MTQRKKVRFPAIGIVLVALIAAVTLVFALVTLPLHVCVISLIGAGMALLLTLVSVILYFALKKVRK